MTNSTTDVLILDDEWLRRFERQKGAALININGSTRFVLLTERDRDALCATVRALRAENERLKLSEEEIKVLTDYHYYEAEKAITRRGDSASQRLPFREVEQTSWNESYLAVAVTGATQMTPEQKQRIEQIENRRLRRYRSTDALANSDRTDREDIGFLLSLVKSQEATRDPDAERVAIAGIQEGLRQRDELAANRMRSACVEKVKLILQRYRDDAEKADMASDNINMLILLHKVSAATEIAKELESVSIQEQK